MKPKPRRGNKTIGLILLAWVIAIFAWTFFRGSALMSGMIGN